MADVKVTPPAGSDDAEVFVSASEDEATPQPEGEVVQQMITPELLSALVKQVEFYFSDANLPTDKKLLKQIRKDPEGYVPVKLFANFRKVRALSKDVGIITEALRSASLLQLSQDGKRVRRLVSVPEYDISDIQRRTIVVENLPGNPSPTIESVTDMFRVYGRVKLVRICSRESKGKLPSWLTSSCQHMGGTQHAYVEFEEEEGAILASAALAQDSDAPDGVVQVRRLLACIAEQRERRSVTGTGSSFGGSSGGGSRKGSRDVSPLGSRNAISRRGSGGGAPYGGSGYSCGGSTWTSSSTGGVATDSFQPAFHPYRSYGGAFDHGSVSRPGSGGGAGQSPPLSFVLPPPPPPPRRSCDSAPVSELLQATAAAAAPTPTPAPPVSGRSVNAYRPPAKRLSDGYQCGFQSSPAGNVYSAVACNAAPQLQRGTGGNFVGSCGTGNTAPASAGCTFTAAPSSPGLTNYINVVANSPPLASRNASSGGGRPPVHPAAVPPPPPPPPPPKLQQSATEHQGSIPSIPQNHIQGPTLMAAAPTVTAAASLPHSSLAEAIAQAQAERRASEAGNKVTTAVATSVDAAPVPIIAPVTSAPLVAPRAVFTAPKFCLDLPTAVPNRGTRGAASQDAAAPAGAEGAVKHTPAQLPRGSQTQMVANVEDFINNILAGRTTPRPAPAQSSNTLASGGAQTRKASGAPASATPRTVVQPPPSQQQQPAVDAAVAVAGIIASTFRRSNPVTSSTPSGVATPAAACSHTSGAGVAVGSVEQGAAVSANRTAAEAPTIQAASYPEVFLTAVSTADESVCLDFSLEHAVTVTVHRTPATGSSAHAMATMDCSGKTKLPIPELAMREVAPAAPPVVSAREVAGAAVVGCGSIGGISTTTSSPPSSPMLLTSRGTATKGSSGKVSVTAPNGTANGQVAPVRASGATQPGTKRLSRRDYAQWAAATPEFRAEAASKYASSSASGSPTSGAGSYGRSSGGGAGTAGGCGSASPPTMAALSISDGGVFGTALPSGPSSGSHYHSMSTTAIWHVAKGPDGSKGFVGRTRVLTA